MHENETSGLLPALPFLLGAVSYKVFPAVTALASTPNPPPMEFVKNSSLMTSPDAPTLGGSLVLALFAVALRVGLALATAQWLQARLGFWRAPRLALGFAGALSGATALSALGHLMFAPQGPAQLWLSTWQFCMAFLIAWVALLAVPREAHTAAMAREAHARHRFLHITLPIIAPAVGFTLIMQSVQALQWLGAPAPGGDDGAAQAAYVRALQLHDAGARAFGLGAAAWGLLLAGAAGGLALSLWARRSCHLRACRMGGPRLPALPTEATPQFAHEADDLSKRMP